MSNNTNKDRISPANIIAIIAVAALGVLTFFGALFQQEDGTIGVAAIKAAIFTFGLGLLLVFCIVTKTVESEFKKWRIVEYFCLGVYLIVAVICYKPFLQFFHVVQHKESLQKMALDEINAIDSLCISYNAKAENEISNAALFMKRYMDSGQDQTDEDGGLSDYIQKHKIKNFDSWRDDYLSIVHFEQEGMDSLRQKAEMWNLMDLSSIAYELKNKAVDTWSDLNEHINNMEKEFELIPSVSRIDADHPYHYDGIVKFDLGTEPNTSAFSKKFREPISGFNIGIIVYIFLHFLALMNYFLVRRSPIIEIKNGNKNDDSGLPLNLKNN